MNKNTWDKEYPVVNNGLSKLAQEDAVRKGYKFKTKKQKQEEKLKSKGNV